MKYGILLYFACYFLYHCVGSLFRGFRQKFDIVRPFSWKGSVFWGISAKNEPVQTSPLCIYPFLGGFGEKMTAFEVTCMDLENTKLVVLSACETGLGDIKNGEGVFGLNRAFKIAGAKNIILSLWQVPDNETGELMNNFYKNWILDKMQVEDAFNKAQRDLKQKYNDPFYWAAFILI